jgi:phage baseplate assembly protein W
MAGIDRITGKWLDDGWAHTAQSIGVILTTSYRSRVMRRGVGAGMPRMVDEPITPANVIDFYAAASQAIADHEPRFRVSRMTVDPTDDAGTLNLSATGVYFPRGHLGDFSVSVPQTVSVPL